MTAEQKIQHSPTVKHKIFYGYVVVAIAVLILTTAQSTRYAFGIFFTPVLTELGWTRAITSGAFSLSAAMEGILAVVMGGLTDRMGPRKILTISGIILGVGYLLMSQVHSVWQFYLFYGVIIGVGMGGFVIPLVSTAARWFAKRRSTMTGIVMCGNSLGTLVGPLVSDWLVGTYKWRMSYVIISIMVFIVIVGAAQLLRRDPRQMGLVPYGESERTEQVTESQEAGLPLKTAIRSGQFWLICVITFCLGFTTMVTVVHLVPNAIDLGISATNAARILSTVGIMMLIGRVGISSTADIFGYKKVFIFCFVMISAVFCELVLAREEWMLYLFAVLFGLVEGGAGPLPPPAMAELFGLKSLGLIMGFTALSVTIGSAIGPYMSGYLFDITGNYQIAFAVCAGIGIVGLISSLLLKTIKVR